MTAKEQPAIRFEPFGPDRIEEIRPWLDDPDVLRFTRIPDPQPPKFLEGWLRGYEDGRRSGETDSEKKRSSCANAMGRSAAPP